MRARSRTRALVASLLIAALVAGALFVVVDPFGLLGLRELSRVLSHRGRAAYAGSASFRSLSPDGTEMVPIDRFPDLAKAVAGDAPKAVREALQRHRIEVLMLKPDATAFAPTSVGAQLASYARVPELRGVYLSRAAVIYASDPVDQLPDAQRQATAVVARALIGGARPPKPASFPDELRRVRPVEVMVLLRRGGRPRLWRSARGSSIASALVTAAVVARQRWQEREQAMGGMLDDLLPSMDVEIALLEDDGTIGDRDPAFIDRVFEEEHGVGYERKGAWRYLLPDATEHAGRGRASRAYRKLFVDDGLPAESFERSELRLYRLLVRSLAISPADKPKPDPLGDVAAPDEVIGASPR